MAEFPPEKVIEALEAQGLDGPAFDVADIARTLTGWLAEGRDLDLLVESAPVEDPIAFVAEWS